MADPRLTPARFDLAARSLEGRVDAERFADGLHTSVRVDVARVHRLPGEDAPVDTEALFGETFIVYDDKDGWAWGQLEQDGYVGYIASTNLLKAHPPLKPTHRILALRTFVYSLPNIKVPPLMALPRGSLVPVENIDTSFAVLSTGGYIWRSHLQDLQPLGRHPDINDVERMVSLAEDMLGVPYLWGGKTPLGCDCSGLVQLSAALAGFFMPRDSDMQASMDSQLVEKTDELDRGDLVFWKGHVGIMRDRQTLLHANGFHMQVVSEPLTTAQTRIVQSGGGDILARHRLISAVHSFS